MTYTLTMATDQGVKIAEDGIAEVSMTDARANLTHLLREVRYGRRPGAFTERGERSAFVVPPDFYDQALRDRAELQAIKDHLAELAGREQNTEAVVSGLQVIQEALDTADRRATEKRRNA